MGVTDKTAEAIIVKRLEDICFPVEPWSLDSVKSTLERSDVFCKVLNSDGGCPIGCYIAAAGFGEAELYRIAVIPEYRGSGYGRALMSDFLKSCPEDTRKIFLEVRESNSAAVGLYERFGFKIIGRRKNYYGNEDAVIYSLEIKR